MTRYTFCVPTAQAMALQFHKLQVRDLRRETADTVSISFDVPESEREAFRFIQGQHLTLKTRIKGEEVRRSYSICTGVGENDLRVAVKKVEDGVFSTWVNDWDNELSTWGDEQLRVGYLLDVMTPQGHFFTKLSEKNENLYVAFVAGSGITPVMSILRTTLKQEPRSRFILFYGNRSFNSIIFRKQLEELKNFYPERLSIHHILSRESLGNELFKGRIDAAKCRRFAQHFFAPSEVDAFFLCGPEEMVFEVKEALINPNEAGASEQKDKPPIKGASPKNIHFELFTTSGVKKKTAEDATPREVFEASITIIQDGVRFNFDLPSDGSTILEAAMRAGADLPFSCKGGVCSTCKAKKLEGEVDMDVNYGLEPDEVEEGFVLTCQSHPTTARVVLSFDG